MTMALKIKEIRALSTEDLKAKILELRRELIKHNAQRATGASAKSAGQARTIKKTIARILTVLQSKGGEPKP